MQALSDLGGIRSRLTGLQFSYAKLSSGWGPNPWSSSCLGGGGSSRRNSSSMELLAECKALRQLEISLWYQDQSSKPLVMSLASLSPLSNLEVLMIDKRPPFQQQLPTNHSTIKCPIDAAVLSSVTAAWPKLRKLTLGLARSDFVAEDLHLLSRFRELRSLDLSCYSVAESEESPMLHLSISSLPKSLQTLELNHVVLHQEDVQGSAANVRVVYRNGRSNGHHRVSVSAGGVGVAANASSSGSKGPNRGLKSVSSLVLSSSSSNHTSAVAVAAGAKLSPPLAAVRPAAVAIAPSRSQLLNSTQSCCLSQFASTAPAAAAVARGPPTAALPPAAAAAATTTAPTKPKPSPFAAAAAVPTVVAVPSSSLAPRPNPFARVGFQTLDQGLSGTTLATTANVTGIAAAASSSGMVSSGSVRKGTPSPFASAGGAAAALGLDMTSPSGAAAGGGGGGGGLSSISSQSDCSRASSVASSTSSVGVGAGTSSKPSPFAAAASGGGGLNPISSHSLASSTSSAAGSGAGAGAGVSSKPSPFMAAAAAAAGAVAITSSSSIGQGAALPSAFAKGASSPFAAAGAVPPKPSPFARSGSGMSAFASVSSVEGIGTASSGVLAAGGVGVLPTIGSGSAHDVLGDTMATLNALMAQSIAAAAADPEELLLAEGGDDDSNSSGVDTAAGAVAGPRTQGSTLAPKLSFWGSVKKLASQASVKKLTGQTSVKPPKPVARGDLVPEGSLRKGFGLSSQGSVKKLVSWGSVQGKTLAPKHAAPPAAVAAAELRSGSFSSSSSRGLLKPAASVVSTGAWAQKPLGQGLNSSSGGGRLATAKSVSFGGSSSSMSREEEGEVVVGLPQLRELKLKHCQLQKVYLMDVVSNPRVSVGSSYCLLHRMLCHSKKPFGPHFNMLQNEQGVREL